MDFLDLQQLDRVPNGCSPLTQLAIALAKNKGKPLQGRRGRIRSKSRLNVTVYEPESRVIVSLRTEFSLLGKSCCIPLLHLGFLQRVFPQSMSSFLDSRNPDCSSDVP